MDGKCVVSRVSPFGFWCFFIVASKTRWLYRWLKPHQIVLEDHLFKGMFCFQTAMKQRSLYYQPKQWTVYYFSWKSLKIAISLHYLILLKWVTRGNPYEMLLMLRANRCEATNRFLRRPSSFQHQQWWWHIGGTSYKTNRTNGFQ